MFKEGDVVVVNIAGSPSRGVVVGVDQREDRFGNPFIKYKVNVDRRGDSFFFFPDELSRD